MTWTNTGPAVAVPCAARPALTPPISPPASPDAVCDAPRPSCAPRTVSAESRPDAASRGHQRHAARHTTTKQTANAATKAAGGTPESPARRVNSFSLSSNCSRIERRPSRQTAEGASSLCRLGCGRPITLGPATPVLSQFDLTGDLPPANHDLKTLTGGNHAIRRRLRSQACRPRPRPSSRPCPRGGRRRPPERRR